MPDDFSITVGPTGGDIVGHTNQELQAAVDGVAAAGGGEVRILAGTYEMHDALHLRSHVRIGGEGNETVLRKAPSVSSALSANLGYGHYDISLAEPDKFRVGMGVHICDDRSGGFYDTVATLTWRRGDRFGISRMLNHDYGRHLNALVTSLFPVINGYELEDVLVEGLAIDGNKDANAYLNGCRGGGVFLQQAHAVTLRRLRVADYNGDGISFQQCRHTVIEGCCLEANTGLGLHPGSGSVGATMRGNACHGNGGDGIFYCLRVSYSLCEGNSIAGNGGVGISIGERDTDHLIRGNAIHDNAKPGIYFRDTDLAMAGSRNVIAGNSVADNCRTQGEAEIDIQGETRDVHILGNSLRPAARPGRSIAGVRIGSRAARIVMCGNCIEGGSATAVENLAGADAVTTERPATPLAVGPAHLPPDGAAHLVAG